MIFMANAKFKEVIDFAIGDEVKTYKFYKEAAEKIDEPSIKEIFEKLALEELEHKRFLEEFAESDENKIVIEVEVDYDIASTIDKPELSTDMKFSDAIALAIKKEEEAMDMYKTLAGSSDDGEVQDLFLGLVDMERLHKTRLEEIWTTVGYSEVW